MFQRNFVRAIGAHRHAAEHPYRGDRPDLAARERARASSQTSNRCITSGYVPRVAYNTGDVDARERAIDGKDRPIFVNTKYSCLATLDPVHSFKPFWSSRPRTAAI